MEFGGIEIGRDDSGDQSVVLVAGQQRARANSSWRNQRRRQQQQQQHCQHLDQRHNQLSRRSRRGGRRGVGRRFVGLGHRTAAQFGRRTGNIPVVGGSPDDALGRGGSRFDYRAGRHDGFGSLGRE